MKISATLFNLPTPPAPTAAISISSTVLVAIIGVIAAVVAALAVTLVVALVIVGGSILGSAVGSRIIWRWGIRGRAIAYRCARLKIRPLVIVVSHPAIVGAPVPPAAVVDSITP